MGMLKMCVEVGSGLREKESVVRFMSEETSAVGRYSRSNCIPQFVKRVS
jgi:hypothetical protein